MAIFYCNADIVSRSKGQNVIAKAAYEARTKLLDEQEGRTKDYTKKEGLLFSDIYTPDNAPDWMSDRASLWNAVKRKEDESKHWKTAQEARRFIIALPQENSVEKNIELSKKIANVFIKYGMVVDFAVHKPDINENEKEINYHMHALTTLRDIDINNVHGFGNKKRSWNDRKFYHDILEKEIAETINLSLPENVQKIEHIPYDETRESYKGSVHEYSRMIIDARERRLKKAQTENLKKSRNISRELTRIEGDKYLEQHIGNLQLKGTVKTEPHKQPEIKTAQPKTRGERIMIMMEKEFEKYGDNKGELQIFKNGTVTTCTAQDIPKLAQNCYGDILKMKKITETALQKPPEGIKESRMNFMKGYNEELAHAAKLVKDNIIESGEPIKTNDYYRNQYKILRNYYNERKKIFATEQPSSTLLDGRYIAAAQLDKVFDKLTADMAKIQMRADEQRRQQEQTQEIRGLEQSGFKR